MNKMQVLSPAEDPTSVNSEDAVRYVIEMVYELALIAGAHGAGELASDLYNLAEKAEVHSRSTTR